MNPVRSRYPIIGIALAAVLIAGIALAPTGAEAQVRKPNVRAASEPVSPCCTITAINARTGLVTAKNLQSGETFQFRVTDRALLRSLKVGQNVYAAEGTGKVGIHAGTACCPIVAPAGAVTSQVNPLEPCCDITVIDARTGLVTAKNLQTGATFQFRVTDRRLLRSLKVGQDVYADQAAKKAGIKPVDPCCTIVAPAQPVDGGAEPYTGSQAQASQSSQAQASEYEAIVAKARGIRPTSLSPRDIQHFNARMVPVRAELQEWAARHGVKLKTETVVHESKIRIRYDIKDGTVSCASTLVINGADCTLVSVRTDGSGENYECVYSCPDGDGKGDDVKDMQENS